MDEEENHNENVVSQTQPDVSGLISEIFGNDSDDEEDIAPKSRLATLDELEDSDDDDDGDMRSRSRLSKSSQQTKMAKSKKVKRKKGDGERIKKKSRKAEQDTRTSTRKRVRTGEKDQLKIASNLEDDGDEYDSGEEIVRTAEDDHFIAEEDDQRDIADEYYAEEQNFDDERPQHKSKSSSRSSRGGTSGTSKKNLDPLSETLEMLKKPKQPVMSETEKARVATDLMTKMDIAARKDDECYRLKQPAVYKLNMLKVVEKIMSIKALHNTLLEYDVLSVLRDWIEPRDAKTLPSLEVRTSVYNMLLKLPCLVDHLKRAAPGIP
jgi:hypothetical protein